MSTFDKLSKHVEQLPDARTGASLLARDVLGATSAHAGRAPEKASFSWPKSSDSTNPVGRAAQFTLISGRSLRRRAGSTRPGACFDGLVVLLMVEAEKLVIRSSASLRRDITAVEAGT
jgi:hypothetical protein